jgi:hypothetical protein
VQERVGFVGEPEAASAAGGGAGDVLECGVEAFRVEGAVAVPDEGGYAVGVCLYGEQGGGGVG